MTIKELKAQEKAVSDRCVALANEATKHRRIWQALWREMEPLMGWLEEIRAELKCRCHTPDVSKRGSSHERTQESTHE